MKTTSAILSSVLLFTSCWGAVGVDVYDEGVGYPPEAYIATATPVYYGGYPHYWYGGRWYRRDGGGWRGFRSEPTYLHEHRARAISPPVNYGRGQYHRVGGYRHR